MDDMELGQLCWAAYGEYPGHHNAGLRALGAAARALLAKPVATREEVIAFMAGRVWSVEDVLAAISHFAPPANNAPILLMTRRDIELSMRADFYQRGPGIDQFMSAAATAERLANTPAPEVDPDAEAKAAYFKYRMVKDTLAYENVKWDWDCLTEQERNGWRAVAAAKKEAGGE